MSDKVVVCICDGVCYNFPCRDEYTINQILSIATNEYLRVIQIRDGDKIIWRAKII